MTRYNVHIYREMKLCFLDVEADTPEQAAATCREYPDEAACGPAVDCDGETFAALVDVQGDLDYSQSVVVDFEAERLRQAAPVLLAALESAHRLILDLGRIVRDLDDDHEWLEFWTNDGEYLCCDSRYDAIVTAIARAKGEGVSGDSPNRFSQTPDRQSRVITPEVIQAIGTVLDYLWEDESRHFEESGQQESHVFASLVTIDRWLGARRPAGS